MKKELLATAMTAVAFGSGAHAQSIPMSWTGMYLSVGWGIAPTRDVVTTDILGNATLQGAGSFGTIGAGVNWDAGNILFGFEGDINFIHSHRSGVVPGPPSAEVETDLERLLTLRARLGVKSDKSLFFATGGLAAGNASLATAYPDLGKATVSGSGSETLFGWTAGFGFEHAVTRTVSINTTALYYRLAPLTVTATGAGVPYTAIYTPQGWLLRAGLNVKLN